MKLPRLFRREKAVPFPQFRDLVRAEARRAHAGCTTEINDTGFVLNISGKPINCNLRQLYMDYIKTPRDKDKLINNYLIAYATEVPDLGWVDARLSLRPMLKDVATLELGQQEIIKSKSDDVLVYEPFVGDLRVMVVREQMGSVTYVTQAQLDKWGVTFADALHDAMNNLNMLNFPMSSSEMKIGGSGKRGKNDGEVVGLQFDGDHMTATWMIMERFREHVSMRLQGDYVIFVPHRARLVAIRVDEPGLMGTMQQANRNLKTQPYALTPQGFLVNSSSIGGQVSIYQGGSAKLETSSPFAAGKTESPQSISQQVTAAYSKPAPVDLSSWAGLSESTSAPVEAAPAPKKTIIRSAK